MTAAWARYDRWNQSVEAEFFDGAWAGRPVYLDMEDEVVARIADRAGEVGDPQEAFKEMVRQTLYLPGEPGHLLELHVRRLRRWRLTSDDEPPPCLAILAFFSWSAEGMRGDDPISPRSSRPQHSSALHDDGRGRRVDLDALADNR